MHTARLIRSSSLPPLALAALLAAAALLPGCAMRAAAPTGPVAGIHDVAQAAEALPGADDDTRLIPQAVQDALYETFVREHFAPWNRALPETDAEEAFWGLDVFAKKRLYGENTLQRDDAWLAALRANARPEAYPSLNMPAVSVAATSMRVLPTDEPAFYDFSKPGEGFPFDYMQNSGVPPATPLFAAHLSADGRWVFCEGRFAYGWIPVRDVAFVDQTFQEIFQLSDLLAVVRDDVPLADPDGTFHCMSEVGMVLPQLSPAWGEAGAQYTVLAERDEHGRAVAVPALLPPGTAAPMPLPATPARFASVAAEFIGEPYGWGDLYGWRDCSGLVLDLYTPFGIPLPRNSSQQAAKGEWIDAAGMNRAAKLELLQRRGLPWMTLVRKPGHVMVYVGERDGTPLVLHALWGLKTERGGREGRLVVGRAIVSTLTPGADRTDLAEDGVLLDAVTGFARIDKPDDGRP